MDQRNAIGIVAIGRNEGERLKACLRSVAGRGTVVYVDSGSSDGSQAFARALGMAVVDLPSPPPFTAARARNAGWAALPAGTRYVQFVDGDCEVAEGWMDRAVAALHADPGLAAVFGRRRERHPDASIYNRMCDDEWDVPLGPALSTGGDALFRVDALAQAGGYTPTLIAGEEPDLCLRLRQVGWRFERLDAEMTLHDAAITRFGQWWRRTQRAGYAYAEHVQRHGAAAIPEWRAQVGRSRLWAERLPALILTAAVVAAASGWHILWLLALALLALYPAQVLRLARRDRRRWPDLATSLKAATLTTLAKFAQLSGMRRYARDQRRKASSGLIEYKN